MCENAQGGMGCAELMSHHWYSPLQVTESNKIVKILRLYLVGSYYFFITSLDAPGLLCRTISCGSKPETANRRSWA